MPDRCYFTAAAAAPACRRASQDKRSRRHVRCPWNTGKAHRGAGDKALRIGDELVEVVKGPLAALGLHASGEVEAVLAFAPSVIDRVVKVRTNLVGAALLERVASRALLGSGSALFDGCGLEQLFNRLRRCRGSSSATGAFQSSFTAISKPGFSGCMRRKDCIGSKIRDEQQPGKCPGCRP